MVRKTVHFWPLGIVALTIGCAAAATPEDSVGEAEQPLLSFPYQGELQYGDIAKADLTWGDFGHVYSFEGIAGQTVTFVVEWREPESRGLGVDISVDDDSWTNLAQYYAYDETKAHLDVTFPSDGTYYLTVAHNYWGWFGTYPYKVGAEPHMCAQVSLAATLPEYGEGVIYAANNHEPGEGNPWTWSPEFGEGAPPMTEIDRDVWMGPCNGLIDDTCGPSDPAVCGGTIVGGGLFDNACAFRTTLNDESGAYSSGVGFYGDASLCSE